ncbi:hypothetical protein B0H11DRAFT_1917033 [Mycena galericulata]|nr:hypothetical protein B0H11DRAFT_1917033 [Mycena galericulata]
MWRYSAFGMRRGKEGREGGKFYEHRISSVQRWRRTREVIQKGGVGGGRWMKVDGIREERGHGTYSHKGKTNEKKDEDVPASSVLRVLACVFIVGAIEECSCGLIRCCTKLLAGSKVPCKVSQRFCAVNGSDKRQELRRYEASMSQISIAQHLWDGQSAAPAPCWSIRERTLRAAERRPRGNDVVARLPRHHGKSTTQMQHPLSERRSPTCTPWEFLLRGEHLRRMSASKREGERHNTHLDMGGLREDAAPPQYQNLGVFTSSITTVCTSGGFSARTASWNTSASVAARSVRCSSTGTRSVVDATAQPKGFVLDLRHLVVHAAYTALAVEREESGSARAIVEGGARGRSRRRDSRKMLDNTRSANLIQATAPRGGFVIEGKDAPLE